MLFRSINGLELAGMVVIAASGLMLLAIDRREVNPAKPDLSAAD